MQKPSNIKLLAIVTKLLILLLVAKIIALGVWWYLPSDGVELNASKSYLVKYHRVDFRDMLGRAKVQSASSPQEKQDRAASPSYSINSLVLKGLYGNRINGFAIVAEKISTKKTTIVAVGEIYQGYKLKEIELDHVIFTKLGKDYLLKLEKSSKQDFSHSLKRIHSENANDESEHRVSKKDINFYSKNPNQIWKDIAIAPVKRNGKIEGFKINRIKRGSKMDMLGLKKGDVIIEANNIKLSSFKDAINLYKNINKIDTIALTVLRNNQEKEIIYEIH